MYKMFLMLLFFILGCSFSKTDGQASIKFDPPSPPIQYVFDVSKVHFVWHYKTSGISSMPTVKLYAEINESYEGILILTGERSIYPIKASYEGRLTGWRNMSVASVVIKNLTSDDFTNYKITVGHSFLQHIVESVTSLQTGVKPTKPKITCAEKVVSYITVREGEDLECSCSSEGSPLPNILWVGGNGSVLRKVKISRNETNIYTCVANNQYGFYNQSVLQVEVQYPPSVSRITSSNQSSYISQMVTFTCAGNGNPVAVYSWKTPDNHTSSGNNTLVVLLHNSRQFGMYTCITSNLYGQTTSNITLKQLLNPGKPRFVSSLSESTFEITIKWSKPDDNGGSIITKYFIRVNRGNRIIAKIETGTEKRQYTKEKLERNTTYTFCVWAENIVGSGNETCADVSTLYKGPLSIPEMPKLTLREETLSVKWDVVAGDPDYYVVEYKTKNENMWTRSLKQGTTKLEYVILSIIPGRIYNVRIVAENSYGDVKGEFAEVLVPTIKPDTRDSSGTLKTFPHETSSSTNKPALGQTSENISSTVIVVVSVLLVLFVIVAVIFLSLWLKRRSAGNDSRNRPDIEHIPGPLGDLYAVVESKKKKDKNDRKDLVYAELSDFDPKASNSEPPPAHHTDYADIAYIRTEADNDYEDIPPSSNEREYASIKEVNRSNSISV